MRAASLIGCQWFVVVLYVMVGSIDRLRNQKANKERESTRAASPLSHRQRRRARNRFTKNVSEHSCIRTPRRLPPKPFLLKPFLDLDRSWGTRTCCGI